MNDIYAKAIEVVVSIVANLIIVGVGAVATRLLSKLAKNQSLKGTEKAVELLTQAVQTTVLELQQVVVDPLKEAAVNGKLSDENIAQLKEALQSKTRQKVAPAIIALLEAAGHDVDALIQGIGEATIYQMQAAQPLAIAESVEPEPEPIG